jgi:hypothetical protein
MKIGYAVKLTFKITQHSRDSELMKSLVKYLDCGRFVPRLGQAAGDFSVTSFIDINEKIIPFFDKYTLHGAKSLDFADFKKVASIIENKGWPPASQGPPSASLVI